VRLDDFRGMVERMLAEVPPEYLEGIASVEVSPRTVPHPSRAQVYTMGECVPLDVGADPAPSRVVLYFGSIQALAQERPGFDWRGEAWETLTHELRHHLEWRARTQDLEEYDWAAEQGFARSEDASFDPLFFLAGEPLGPDTYQVDDDVFVDRPVRDPPETVEIAWHGRRYQVPVPAEPLPLYLAVAGLAAPPAGELIVVLRRRPRLLDLFRRPARVTERRVEARPLDR
jgi:hypothetical protein